MSETTTSKKAEAKPSPKKCTHERWDEFLQSNYKRTLFNVAQELGYSEQNLDILGCDGKDQMQKKVVYKKHKKLFDAFLKDERLKELVDGRNVLDYFKDLIASWIGEDLLVKALNEYGFKAELANADSDRVIKTERVNVTGEPDIKIEFEGVTRYLELMDALSPVERFGQFDLRLSKAKNQFNRKTLFLLHGLADRKYVLIDFMRDNVVVTYNYPNPRFGNKPCSVVRMEENGIKMQEMSIFWESLKDIMLNTRPEPDVHYLKLVDYNTGAVEVLGNDGSADSSEVDEEIEEVESEEAAEVEKDMQEEDPPQEETEAEESPSEKKTEDVQGEEDAEEEPQDEGVSGDPVSEQNGHDEAEEDEVQDEEPMQEEDGADEEPPMPQENDEDSVIEEDDDGNEVEYTSEQWAALNDVF